MGPIMLVGDTHSDSDAWARIVAEAASLGVDQLLQVGDLNVWPYADIFSKINQRFFPHLIELLEHHQKKVRFVRGNHDDPATLETWPEHGSGMRRLGSRLEYAPTGRRWSWQGCSFLAVGGAYSINEAAQRKQGIYSEREILSEEEVELCVADGPVDVMVCHDVPIGIDLEELHQRHGKMFTKTDEQTNANRDRLQRVAEAVRPQLIIHGHYHLWGRHIMTAPWGEVRVISLGQNGRLGGYALLDLESFEVTFLGSQ